MRVLFTGVGRRVELVHAFREAALALSKDLRVYGVDMDSTAPALAYCDVARSTVAMRDPGYVDDLLRICQEDEIDLVVPTIDTDLLVLARSRERFEAAGTRVLVSDPDKVAICRDKRLTSRFFVDCGLSAPMPVDDWREYNAGFPAFIKPKDGSSSIDAYRVGNAEELELYANQVADYIVQPFVEGREYTIDIFCDWDGVPVSIVPRERLQVRAGEVLKTKIAMDSRMIEEAEALCEVFRPRGPMTVQLIRDENGIDWFIEINPRFGGGAPLSMRSGARSAEAVLRMLDSDKLERRPPVEDGAVYSRFDQSARVSGGKSELRGVIFDLDDTLYLERDYVRSGFRAVSDLLGGGYEGRLWEHFEAGRPAIDALLAGLGREGKHDEALKAYRSHRPNIRLCPDAIQVLNELKDKGVKVGIITDGRPEGQRAKLDTLGLWDMVDDIIITDELGGPQFRKPCDIAFRVMQRRWRIPFESMAYVGDNPAKDFQAPRQLGMKCVWYRNTDGLYSAEDSSDRSTCILCIADLMEVLNA